jgi:hypothetical protein
MKEEKKRMRLMINQNYILEKKEEEQRRKKTSYICLYFHSLCSRPGTVNVIVGCCNVGVLPNGL